MLSRSNGNAGDRLRRVKSNSSVHTSSSGHQRSSTSTDPFVIRQQAEVAAVEAYHRARQNAEPSCQPYRPVPQRPQRRKSQVTGKTEGGHFEDARLGRSRSTSKRDSEAKTNVSRSRHSGSDFTSTSSNDGDHVRFGKRSAILPVSFNGLAREHDVLFSPSANGFTRASQPACNDGSPVPRHGPTMQERSSRAGMQRLAADSNFKHQEHIADLSVFEAPPDGTHQGVKTPTTCAQRVHHDNYLDIVPSGAELRDFQPKKLRERKSFILAPFQKRSFTNTQSHRGSGYDTSLLPFNFAGEQEPPLPPVEVHIPPVTIVDDSKGRKFSNSLKWRIKKVFRRTSRAPSGLPAQQIEAKHFHYTTSSPLSTPVIQSEHDEDPFIAATDRVRLAAPELNVDSAGSQHSPSIQSNGRSRVTSWTNSTVTGTCGTRNEVNLSSTADEQGRLKRSGSLSSIRKASSIFGKPLMSRLRRPSRAHLRSSDESDDLYFALQERIHSPILEVTASRVDQPSNDKSLIDISGLPSQRKRAGLVFDGQSQWPAPTIRSVTPDPLIGKVEKLSPLTEAVSPEGYHQSSPKRACQDEEASEPTPCSHLQRRPAMKASMPSKEQIEKRIQRSKNRWQSPLDEISSPEPKPMRKAMMDDNPYELRSLSRTLQHPIVENSLPHHARADERLINGRQDILSPSLYSHGSDCESPQPGTPIEQGGMVVTITGREVRSYSISPPKRDQHTYHAVQASGEWRRWLSDEMHGWDANILKDGFQLPKVEANGSLAVRVQGPTSSETRTFQRQDGALTDTRQSEYRSEPAKVMDRPRVVRKSKSITPADEVPAYGGEASLNDMPPSTELCSSKPFDPAAKTKPASKAKSAFDLQANYKSNATTKAKPIEVRRKPNANGNVNLLDDSTIQNISAGPYASQHLYASSNVLEANKENTLPSDSGALPSVSSSEWLAAGAHKVRDVRRTSTAYGGRSLSRYSPSRMGIAVTSGGSSAGQRLASSWLDGRSKENSPAFM